MCKLLFGFGFLAVALLLMCTQSWAACESPVRGAGPADPVSITCHYTATPAVTSNTYDFGFPTLDTLRIEFSAVLRDFDLTMTRKYISTTDFQNRLSPKFPDGTTCYPYSFVPDVNKPCTVYDGPTSIPPLPIKGTDYLGPVTWEITYSTTDSSGKPALAHAKGTSLTYTEDILTFYVLIPAVDDGADMAGSSNGLTSIAAAKEPAGNNCFIWVSPANDAQSFPVGTKEIEVEFKLYPSSACGVGTPIRDHDARLSLARVEGNQAFPVHLEKEARHFNFDNQEKVNELEIDATELPSGRYTITVISDEFGARRRTFCKGLSFCF